MIERANTESSAPHAAPAMPKMEIRGVSKKFQTRRGEVVALAECDLAVQKAEFVTVVGPSGCGKSTLMMIAAGLTEPSTGDILVDGRPAGPPGPKRSVVFQRFALFPSETAAQNIECENLGGGNAPVVWNSSSNRCYYCYVHTGTIASGQPGFFLHAATLQMAVGPDTLSLEAPLPARFTAALAALGL